MKTYEYKVNAGKTTEYTFFFKATNKDEADAIAKARTKRNEKAECIETHPASHLQALQSEDHSSKTPVSKSRTFFFECNRKHVWTHEEAFSHMFKTICPECSRKSVLKVEPITYEFLVDWTQNPVTATHKGV